MDKPLLFYTGHPFVDVGIAGICAFSKKTKPEDITLNDLDAVSDYMEKIYYDGKLDPFLTCVFMNAVFVPPNRQPESPKFQENKDKEISQYFRAHRSNPDTRVAQQKCIFSGKPAIAALNRTHLPLFSGEEIMNFRPEGQTWVPVAGPFVVAIMFLPLAGRRAEGKLLIVHSSDYTILVEFAKKYLEDNRRLIALNLPDSSAISFPDYYREVPMWDTKKKSYKFPDVKGPRSLVISDLTEIAGKAAPSDLNPISSSLTIYLLSNSGQGPSLEIFDVPSNAVAFIRKSAGTLTAGVWKAISSRFMEIEGSSKDGSVGGKRKRIKIKGQPGWSRNPAFEEFYKIFTSGFTDQLLAQKWLRRYVLGRLKSSKKEKKYETTNARMWNFTKIFLEEVIGMKEGRVEAIRNFADKIANWIKTNNDRRLHNSLFYDKTWELRRALLRAQQESAKKNLLFGLDEFTQVWFHSEGRKSDEELVRDLVGIRVVEKLYNLNYYKEHPEDIIDKQIEKNEEAENRREVNNQEEIEESEDE